MYEYLWRNKFLTIEAKTIDDMIDTLAAAAEHLRAMKADGVTLDPGGGTGDDYASLITEDPAVAKKYNMDDRDRDEGWDDDEDE